MKLCNECVGKQYLKTGQKISPESSGFGKCDACGKLRSCSGTIESMKAITLLQPYGSLLAYLIKLYETRGWETSYRGPIAIHAAALNPFKVIRELGDNTISAMMRELRAKGALPQDGDFRYLPTGSIIATAELIGCYPIVEPAKIEGMVSTGKMIKPDIPVSVYGNELLFGDWTPGRYAWEFANMTLLPEPIPAKGMQGLWNWEMPI